MFSGMFFCLSNLSEFIYLREEGSVYNAKVRL